MLNSKQSILLLCLPHATNFIGINNGLSQPIPLEIEFTRS